MAWVPIESNPDVMNKLLNNFGVSKDWEVMDIYGTDPDLLAFIPQPVLAVILLFPMSENLNKFMEEEEKKSLTSGDQNSKNLLFIKQFISNACGTMALIHSIINNLDIINLADGPLKDFTKSIEGLSPEAAGEALVERDDIAKVHEKVAAEGQTQAPDPSVNLNHHFIALVEKDGNLYELDGRKSVPIKHSTTTKETLLQDATKVIRRYMESDPENIHFTMMALTAACT